MRFKRRSFVASILSTALLMASLGSTAVAKITPETSAAPKPGKTAIHSAGKASRKRAGRGRRGSWKRHGQQAIDQPRTREIQAALIEKKYMNGEPTGVWDQRTKSALVRFQSERGWQTKQVPDSRALIELGLGPKHENLLNPESLAAFPVVALPASSARR